MSIELKIVSVEIRLASAVKKAVCGVDAHVDFCDRQITFTRGDGDLFAASEKGGGDNRTSLWTSNSAKCMLDCNLMRGYFGDEHVGVNVTVDVGKVSAPTTYKLRNTVRVRHLLTPPYYFADLVNEEAPLYSLSIGSADTVLCGVVLRAKWISPVSVPMVPPAMVTTGTASKSLPTVDTETEDEQGDESEDDASDDDDELELLGEGGFASVVDGTWMGASVAVKCYTGQVYQGAESEFFDLVHEVSLMSKLRHPCIVQPLAITVRHGEMLLVMERVFGVDLHQYRIVQRRDISWSLLLAAARDVCNALGVMHLHEIAHGDVKPANVLLVGVSADENKDVSPAQACDFGVTAKLCDFGSATHSLKTAARGSLDYCAPELFSIRANQGEIVGAKCDVYGVAMTLYAAMVGFDPLYTNKERFMHMKEKSVANGWRPPLPASTPDAVAKIIKEAWRGNASERPEVGGVQQYVCALLEGDDVREWAPPTQLSDKDVEHLTFVEEFQKRSILDWSPADVAFWLRSLDMPNVERVAAEHAICGLDLLVKDKKWLRRRGVRGVQIRNRLRSACTKWLLENKKTALRDEVMAKSVVLHVSKRGQTATRVLLTPDSVKKCDADSVYTISEFEQMLKDVKSSLGSQPMHIYRATSLRMHSSELKRGDAQLFATAMDARALLQGNGGAGVFLRAVKAKRAPSNAVSLASVSEAVADPASSRSNSYDGNTTPRSLRSKSMSSRRLVSISEDEVPVRMHRVASDAGSGEDSDDEDSSASASTSRKHSRSRRLSNIRRAGSNDALLKALSSDRPKGVADGGSGRRHSLSRSARSTPVKA